MKIIKLFFALVGATQLSANALAVDNIPPSVNGIPGQTINEGGKFATIKLDSYVCDDMDKPEQIKWSVSGNKNLKVKISADRVATIETPHQYWNGEENITFAATDSKGAIGSETVTFTVKHVFDENGFCQCDYYQPAEKNDDGYYKIANAGNLCWFADYVNQLGDNLKANAILTNDIVVNTLKFADGEIVTGGWVYRVWSPIGPDCNYPYQGTFDGNGYTISGLYFNDPDQDFVGLFGCNNGTIQNAGVVDSYFYGKDHVGGVCGCNNGTIQNAGVVDSYFYGKDHVGGVCGGNAEGKIENCYNTGNVNGSVSEVGGVCGYNARGTITNCHNTGNVNGSYNEVGGVCGYNFEGKIENCYNTGNVNGSCNEVGGVCGYNAGGTITNCHNTGNVNGSYNEVGGVCGDVGNYCTITNCYNTGEVNGDSHVGGVLGILEQYCNIENCYNTGEVNGSGDYVGGVCGENYGTITNCYNTGEVSGSQYIGGVCGYKDYGDITNCYFLSGTDANATLATSEQFASGEVAYKLGGAFYQKLGVDAFPVLDSTHGKVYLASPCIAYSNAENATVEHKFDVNGFCTVCGAYEPAGKDADGVYQIANAGNLYWFANFVNQGNFTANAILTDDIVVNTLDFSDGEIVTDGKDYGVWGPIGYYDDLNNIINYYQGTFNGNGHTISGLYFNNSNKSNVGLFGYNKGTIKNVGVVDSYFNGSEIVGGVCGENYEGTIENCYNTGEVNGEYNIGGVCGKNYAGPITNCYNTGEVNGSSYVGGVCGNTYGKDTIENCYNTGEVNGEYNIGGVCGYNSNETITNCYNTGEVNGNGDYVGGMCGYNYDGPITNCYNTGEVNGNGDYVGGMCGYNFNIESTITNCYYLETSANTGIGEGDGEATAKTATQFADGTVAKLLFASDTIWGQNTSTDTVPNFSGKILFKVTLTAENGTAENGLGEYNKKYEIKATANTGYHFVEWSNGSTEIKDSILVVNDTALVATFEAHSFGNWDTTLVATCTTSGLRTHACACGEVETDTIAALGHKVVVDSAVVATCTVAGLTEGSHCSVCGEVIKAQQTIPALGHSFTNYIYNNDATIEADGTETAECDREGCNAIDVRTAEGTKLQTSVGTESAEGVVIYAHHNTIVVENATEDIYVYDATGRCVASRDAEFHVSIAMPREGIYIVRTGDKVQRVAVK